MIYTQLGKTGVTVSRLGFGCAALGNQYGDIQDSEAIRAVHAALDQGITFFDTSAFYGRTLSETRLGQALVGQRQNVILATKGGRIDRDEFDFSTAGILNMCTASLRRLQTDYLDIYQLHDIEFGDPSQIINEAIPALQQLKQEGKVRFIGVTGYPLPLLHQIIETHQLDVTLSYCHYNLLNTTLNDVLVPAVKAKQMGLINGSVTHMGILTDQGPPPWHPASAPVKQVGRKVAAYCRQQGTPVAHLAIQFALQNEAVDVTLLGTRTVTELNESVQLLEQPPDPTLLASVLAMIEPVANLSWSSGRWEPHE
jgi:L-galactose dehydrogenase